jgi:hypothetical protein
MNGTAPAAGSGADGSNKALTVLVRFDMKTTLRSHDLWRSGIRRKDAARR